MVLRATSDKWGAKAGAPSHLIAKFSSINNLVTFSDIKLYVTINQQVGMVLRSAFTLGMLLEVHLGPMKQLYAPNMRLLS